MKGEGEMANEILKSQILQVVDNQMNLDEPKFVNPTFRRLVGEGHTRQEAKEMIGGALIAEMYTVLKENTPFDEKRYEEKLNGLGKGLVQDGEAILDETEYTIKELIDLISYNTGTFPKEVLREIIHEKEQAIPFLLDILRDTKDNPEKYIEDPDYFAHIYASYLLAQFRVNEAYPLLIDLMSLPEDQAYDLFGDSMLEAGSRMLASVCAGDTSLIKGLVENEDADEYMRSQAIEALTILAVQGVVDHNAVVDYYRKLLQENSIRKDSLLLAFLAIACCDMYAKELYEDLKKCFEDGLVDQTVIDAKDLEETFRRERHDVLEESRNETHLQFIEDTIAELEHWSCFEDDEQNFREVKKNLENLQTIIKAEKVGRNDPCPCGSGKKYKKCCGKQA